MLLQTIKKFIFHIIFILFTTHLKAQPSKLVWLSGTMPVIITSKWQWINDASFRTTFQTTPQLIIRTGIVYNATQNIKIATGYAVSFTKNYSNLLQNEYDTENRIWQEAVLQHEFNHFFTVRNRLRTEQRFFNATTTKNAFYTIRYRYKIDGIFTLYKKYQVILFNEFMMQHSNTKFNVDQNRTQLAVAYKCNNDLQFQIAIMALKRPINGSQKVLVLSFSKYLKC